MKAALVVLALAVLAASLILLAGCDGNGISPPTAYEGDFAPLAVNSTWHYTGVLSGSGPGGPVSGTFTATVTDTGTSTVNGFADAHALSVTYQVESGNITAPPSYTDFLIKQDGDTYVVAYQEDGQALITYAAPQLVIPAPLVVGDTWNASAYVRGEPWTEVFTIGTALFVTVPAGAFAAIPITDVLNGTVQGITYTGSATGRLARDVGSIKSTVNLTGTLAAQSATVSGTLSLSSFSRASGTAAGPVGPVLITIAASTIQSLLQ